MPHAIQQAATVASVMLFLTAPTVQAAQAAPSVPYRLKNGMTVILCPVTAADQVAVVVLFDLGADHDPPGESGRAHLLEHLYCTAAAGQTPPRDFAQIQKRYAAGHNQQTGQDFTVFAGVVKPDKLTEELKDAAARMSDLRIADADLQREVPRVLAELENMYGGMPSLAGLNHVRMRLHPIAQGGRHGGAPDHLKAITLAELRKFWQDCYKPSNAILVLAGRFDLAEARKLIQQHFGPIAAGNPGAPGPAGPPKPPAKTGITHRIKVTPIMPNAAGVVAVGYAAPLPGTPDYAPFLVVVSRLWALAPAGGARPGQVQPLYYPMLDDPGTIALQAPLPPGSDPQAVLNQLDPRLQTALKAQLTPLDKMRTVNSMAMLGTTNAPDAMWARNLYGLAFSTGRRHQLKIDGKQLRAAIQRATDADLKRLAQTVFPPAKRVAVIVEVDGPTAPPPARSP